MKLFTPEIAWHSRDAIFSVDFQKSQGDFYRVATGGIERHIKIWRVNLVKNDVKVEFLSNLKRHQNTINVLRFSPNGVFLASGDSEGVVNIWELSSTVQPDIFKSNLDEDEPDNVETWTVKKRLREHKAESDVCDLCWSPDSKTLLTVSTDGSIIVWDMVAGKKQKLITESAKRFPVGIVWDPQSEFFISMTNDRVMSVYNATNFQKLNAVTSASVNIPSNLEKKVKCKLFHDDSLMSYVRRPCFTVGGEFLIAPAGCIEDSGKIDYCSYIFSRTNFKQPCIILPSPNEPTIGVYCCPKTWKLSSSSANMTKLQHRYIFAVLTKKSVLFYDTQHQDPIGFVTNIHYVSLTDCSWSGDGKFLIVSSEDGYCTFISIESGDFGND